MARKERTISFEISGGYIATVSECDADLANIYWEIHGSGCNKYARRRIMRQGKRSWQQMHRVILERKLGRPIKPGLQTDHIDRNGLNNRRSNLREVTQSQNMHNRRATRTNKSAIKGVTWHKRDKIWQAQVTYHGKTHYIGRFHSRDMAYLAVVKKRKELGIRDPQ